MKNIAKQYNIGRSTVSDIYKQKEKINEYAGNDTDYLTRKKLNKKVRYPSLESKLLEWYENSRRQKGLFLSGSIIQQKAKELFKELGCEGNFCASKGWLDRFKSRNGIKLCGFIQVQSDAKYDQNAVDSLTAHLQSFIQCYNLSPEQIYSADETDLFWKLMPKPSSVKNELEASTSAYRERMTLLACTNSTGNHKLPLVCIGRKSRGITSADIRNLPLIYYSHETAWIDTNIFYDWYHNIFVPNVRKHLRSCGLPEAALLIINQNPSHPNLEYLKTSDNSFNVLFLSPNVKDSLQPIQLGIIQDLKSFYRYSLLSNVIKNNMIFADYEKQLVLIDSLKMLGAAWDSISSHRIQQAFFKILSINDFVDIQECEANAKSFSELIEIIPECILYNYTMVRLTNWLFCDNVNCPRDSVNIWHASSSSEMDFQHNEESTVYKQVSKNDNCVIFEEIGRNESSEPSEDIDDIPTQSNCNVSTEDALSAIDTILKFVKSDPKTKSNVEFLLELKDNICNRNV